VQGSFGFNFGNLTKLPAKQSSLPPQRSSRRTPIEDIQHGANGSSQRHRSASVQRSSGTKRKTTPSAYALTPRLGKRKRGSPSAQANIGNDDLDELSPDRQENIPSIERSRKQVRASLPLPEEVNQSLKELSMLEEEPDELSIIEHNTNTLNSPALSASELSNKTPALRRAGKPRSASSTSHEPQTADRTGNMADIERRSVFRRSDSLGPKTPQVLSTGRTKHVPTSRLVAESNTPVVVLGEDESADELSPSHINGNISTISAKKPRRNLVAPPEDDRDELSTPMQPPSTKRANNAKKAADLAHLNGNATTPSRAVSSRRRQAKGDDTMESITTVESTAFAEEVDNRANPVASKPGTQNDNDAVVQNGFEEDLDELSPEPRHAYRRPGSSTGRRKLVARKANKRLSDEYEETQSEVGDEREQGPEPTTTNSFPKQAQHATAPTGKIARKRQTFTGPKHAISVMRIKGSSVRGITVADTTRTILENAIDHRLERMMTKIQTSQDSTHRKELRGGINLTLSFKESLEEKLLDLQDANDVLSSKLKQLKTFRRNNVDLRKDILALQNDRHEAALELDDVLAEYEAEKSTSDTRSTLNANMIGIEAAVQNGRDRARDEGRQDEGPAIPLSMFLENVGRAVGSSGGGLLSILKNFNGSLEKAAGWLEGRV
jgi:hypothetical protein